MINSNFILHLIFVLGIHISAFSQYDLLKPRHKDEIQKNLIAYQIRYFIDDTYFCIGSFESEINDFFTKENEEYNLAYIVYKDEKYYNDEILLFIVYNNYYGKIIKNSNKRVVVAFTHGKSYSSRIARKILIGYNKNSGRITYISGNVFKNCISQHFNLNKNNPETFRYFLELKLFNYDIEKLKLKKKRKKYLLFTAYSKALKEEIFIKVNPVNFDMLQVKTIKSNWTERGNYRWE